jgi:hypothetical protein
MQPAEQALAALLKMSEDSEGSSDVSFGGLHSVMLPGSIP